jgi:hypothetical protein
LTCALGRVRTGFDNGARIRLRVRYECSTVDSVGQNSVAVTSPAGDIDRSNDDAFVDELEARCPEPPPDPESPSEASPDF